MLRKTAAMFVTLVLVMVVLVAPFNVSAAVSNTTRHNKMESFQEDIVQQLQSTYSERGIVLGNIQMKFQTLTRGSIPFLFSGTTYDATNGNTAIGEITITASLNETASGYVFDMAIPPQASHYVTNTTSYFYMSGTISAYYSSSTMLSYSVSAARRADGVTITGSGYVYLSGKTGIHVVTT